MTQQAHKWSGWPGAFCLKCGTSDTMEIAIGRGLFDPFTGEWESEEASEVYRETPCLVSDAECEEHQAQRRRQQLGEDDHE